jgi:hypothetical protein
MWVLEIIAEFFLSSLQMKVYLDKSDGMKVRTGNNDDVFIKTQLVQVF